MAPAPVAADLLQLSADCRRDTLNGFAGFVELRAQNPDASGTKNAGLVLGDRGQRSAERRRVIVADRRDCRDERLDDVGGIEATTHTNFEHGDLYLLLGKMEEGERGADLECRRLA